MDISQLEMISSELADFVELFAPDLGRVERQHWCKMYLSGLLLDGERKSIQPIAQRLQGANEQALQQFVNQSPWNSEALTINLMKFMTKRLKMSSQVLVLDNVTLPKKGKASVGVARQYCGALGKIANCQTLVSWQTVEARQHIPLCAQLYLPGEWTNDSSRMNRVGVPLRYQRFREKWKIALDLLDKVSPHLAPEVLLFDAEYGNNRYFLLEFD